MTDEILLNSPECKHVVHSDESVIRCKESSRYDCLIRLTVVTLISLALTLCVHAWSHLLAESHSMISKGLGSILHVLRYKLASYSLECVHLGPSVHPKPFSFILYICKPPH